MFNVHVENIGDLAVIGCEGRIVQSDAAYKLRAAITSQKEAKTIVLDLSEVYAMEGGGLGMLMFLQRWARDHNVRLKVFNPTKSVRDRLEHANPMSEVDIASVDELMALLELAGSQAPRV